MSKFRYTIIALMIMLIFTSCSQLSLTSTDIVKANTWYVVNKVLDGNRIEVMAGNQSHIIRLLYIESPQNSEDGFIDAASEFIDNALGETREVKLSFDQVMQNEQNEWLAVVELKDGTFLNERLLEEGLAKVLIEEPNVKMENVYKQIEQFSKQNKLGIWSTGNETSNGEVQIKETPNSGISLYVNKYSQKATITNYTNETIHLDQWKLVSVSGNQTYLFDDIELKPNQKIHILAKEKLPTAVSNTYLWGVANVWDIAGEDPAELYNINNELIAVWED